MKKPIFFVPSGSVFSDIYLIIRIHKLFNASSENQNFYLKGEIVSTSFNIVTNNNMCRLRKS